MAINRRNWIVSVTTDDDDAAIFGPYTQGRAESLADRFNTLTTEMEDTGRVYINASAYPIDNPDVIGMLTEFGL